MSQVKYYGIINPSIKDEQYSVLETLLNLEEGSLDSIYWEVEFYVYGKYVEQTWTQPAEYAEIGDVLVLKATLQLLDGTDLPTTPEQLALIEQYCPKDDELFWDIITTENKKFED
jgi:hypothetical protein